MGTALRNGDQRYAVGDHETAEFGDRERAKLLGEIEALAYSLVGCDADLAISSLASLDTRGTATPDFRATLLDGSEVDIELCRVIDEDEKIYLDTLTKIQGRVNETLAAEHDLPDGLMTVRFYGGKPQPDQVKVISNELIEVVHHDGRIGDRSSFTRVGPEWPAMHRLEGYRGLRDAEHPLRIHLEWNRRHFDYGRTAAAFDRILAKKRGKGADYRNDRPLWLAMYVDTRLSYPLQLVEDLRKREDVEIAPFERVMLGCFTAGVTFRRSSTAPSYSSLTSSG